MTAAMLSKLSQSWKRLSRLQSEESALDTLSAFVKDSEHEMLSVITALQAHIDLLHDEQVRNKLPIARFDVLNHAVSRLVKGTGILATVSTEAKTPKPKTKQVLQKLVQDVVEETTAAFKLSKVSIKCDLAEGATLVGNADLLKIMIKEIILVILPTCQELDTLNIVGHSLKKCISLAFDVGALPNSREFLPWQLGNLRLLPTNGEGITLSAVDAVAKLNNGFLSIRGAADDRKGYKLTFMGQQEDRTEKH